MQIEVMDINKLVLDPSNARKHNEKNLEAIKGSLAKFGQQKPIVINKDNVVIAGNGTLVAARALGWTEIQVVQTDLTGTNLIAFGLADNRTSELAQWDDDVLGPLLHSLREEDFSLTDIGFDINDFLTSSVDYSVLDESDMGENLDDLKNGVRKAILIEFELEHYEEAFALIKFWRSKSGNIGMMILNYLKQEKEKL